MATITFDQLARSFLTSDNVELLERAIQQGFDVNAKDLFYGTLLNVACFFRRRHCVKVLLENHADPNSYSFCSALMMASVSDVECLKLVLQAGADVNFKESGYWTPLMRASITGRLDCVECLLEAGIDPLSVDNKGKTASQIARENGHLEVADFIDSYSGPIKSALEYNEY